MQQQPQQRDIGRLLKGAEEVPLRRFDCSSGVNLVVACPHPVTGRSDALVLLSQLALPNGGCLLKLQFVQERTEFYGHVEDFDLSRKGAFVAVDVSADSRWLVLVSGGRRLAGKSEQTAARGHCVLLDLSLLNEATLIEATCSFETKGGSILAAKWHPENAKLLGILHISGAFELREIDASRRCCIEMRHLSLRTSPIDFAFISVTEDPTQVIIIALTESGSLDLHFAAVSGHAAHVSSTSLSLLGGAGADPESSEPWVAVAVLLSGELCLVAMMRTNGCVKCVGCSGSALLTSYACGIGVPASFVVDRFKLPVEGPLKGLTAGKDSPPEGQVLLAYGESEWFVVQCPWVAQLSKASTAYCPGLLGPPPLMPSTAVRAGSPGTSVICGAAAIRCSAWIVKGQLVAELPTISGLGKATDWGAVEELDIQTVDLVPYLANKASMIDYKRTMHELWKAAVEVPDRDANGEENAVEEKVVAATVDTVSCQSAGKLIDQFVKELHEIKENFKTQKMFNIQGTEDCPPSISAVLSTLEVSAANVGRVAALVEHLQLVTERLKHISPSVPCARIQALDWNPLLDRIARMEKVQEELRDKTTRVSDKLQERLEQSLAALVQARYLPVLLMGSEKAAGHIATLLSEKYGA